MLTLAGSQFIDRQGREVHLRGVNLGGSSKMPPAEPTHIANNFSKHREVSFIGRPFPRSEAHQHYARLRHWGFNCLRFITTWEAIEHAGPGEYDNAYLDYLHEMVALAGEYGFYVFIDPHQDVWSRMTGGDGAPGWTLELVGFDLQNLDLSEAAITMQRRYPDYPAMVWTDNYSRLACMTMFTLFFCGDKLGVQINGQSVQEQLQGAFIRAIQQVAARLQGMEHVIGYGPLNEPGKGYLGLKSLQEIDGIPQKIIQLSPAESILVGAGFARKVRQAKLVGWNATLGDEILANPHQISAWKGRDLWHELGVWDVDSAGQPTIIKDDFFAQTDFLNDGLLPFIKRFAAAVRTIDPEAIIFSETTPSEASHFRLDTTDLDRVVNGSHWYDVFMLFSKTFDGETAIDLGKFEMVTGRENIARSFGENIAKMVENSQGKVPTLIGEFGLAFDINQKHAYQTGDFSLHELALSLYHDAIDANLAHSTLWNYTADNTNEWGDNWNQEDLSIFSLDQYTDPSDIHSGGRAIRGFCRPHVPRVAGHLVSRHFDYTTGIFTAEVEFKAVHDIPTLIYIPEIWYKDGFVVEISSGTWEPGAQMISWTNAEIGIQTVRIKPKT